MYAVQRMLVHAKVIKYKEVKELASSYRQRGGEVRVD
jgi:hypothetical protein